MSAPTDGDGRTIEGIALGPDERPPDPPETITGEQPRMPFTRVRIAPPRRWRRVGSWNEMLECPVDGTLVSGRRGAHLHLQHFHNDDQAGEMLAWLEDLDDEMGAAWEHVNRFARRREPSDKRRVWGPAWWRFHGHSKKPGE